VDRRQPPRRKCGARWRGRLRDEFGRSVFKDLFTRRGDCYYFAFDLLSLNGDDLRGLPLVERKARLKRLLRTKTSRILYVGHIDTQGRALFEKACKLDLEGIVAKRKHSTYRATEKPSTHWIKVKNPQYSQVQGREELFERT
jgi:ATP-dependent DNA ligase